MAVHFYRSIVTVALIAAILMNVSVVGAQTTDDREAKIAAAFKVLEEAIALGQRPDAASRAAAIEKFKAAEKVFEEQKSDPDLAGAYTLHGSALLPAGDIDAAFALISRSLEMFRVQKDLGGQTISLMNLGSIYIVRREMEKARASLEEAWTFNEKAPLPGIDRQLLMLLGTAYISLREYKKALDTYWKVVELTKDKGGDEPIIAFKNYANALVQLDMPTNAVFWFERALKMAREANLKPREADLLNQLGSLFLYQLSEPEKARAYYLHALRVAEPLDLPQLKSEVLNGLGQCAMRTMDVANAMGYYNQALSFVSKFPKSEGRHASILFDISQIQQLLDERVKARATLEQALALAKTANEPLLQSNILQGLSALEVADGVDPLRAAELSNEAGLILTKLPYPTRQAVDWLNNFALLCIGSGRIELATESLARALNMSKQLQYRFGEATNIETTGILYFRQGNYQNAIERYNEALVTYRALGIKPREARTLENLMTAWSKAGNSNLAIFFGKSAVNIYQGFQKNSSSISADQRKAFMETFASAYRSLAKVLIEQGRIAEAEQVLTMLKQEELLEYVRRDDAVSKQLLETMALSDDERAAIARYGALAEQITAIGKEFGDLDVERKQFNSGEFPKQKRWAELKQQLADATTAFQKFLDELKLKFGQNDARVAQVDSSLKKTLDGMKATTTAAVATIVGEDTLNIIVTTSKTQRAHTIKIRSAEINDLVAKFRTALTSSQYDPRPVGQRFYDLIVKPIEGDLAGIKTDTILWSLDGSLRYVPPAAFWDKQKGYMVERFANVMVNLASRDNLRLNTNTGQQLSVLGVGVSKPTDGFPGLTAVPDELDCIVADKSTGLLSTKPQCTNGVLNGRKLLDEKFNLANFEGELGRYPIVHIASHFKLTPGDDKNSFLLLGGGVDRKFTIEKLRSEPLTDVELIVLSACNTATPGGSRTNGLEVEGFGSIAQEKGAKSVMATLWAVADTSTKDFMVEFYRLYGKDGLSKAEAVRKAQLKLMYGKYSADAVQKRRADEFVTATDKTLPKFTPDPNAPFAHPYFWSPFTLIGNWR